MEPVFDDLCGPVSRNVCIFNAKIIFEGNLTLIADTAMVKIVVEKALVGKGSIPLGGLMRQSVFGDIAL